MNSIGVGDLSSVVQARRQNSNIKSELLRLTAELSSGERADISKATSGKLAPLALIERSLSLNSAYEAAATKAELTLAFSQSALEAVSIGIDGLGASLLASASSGPIANDAVISGAANRFEAAVAALSVRAGNEYIFSGIGSDQRPLANADTMLTELAAATAGVTDADVFSETVSDWFSAAGGFETLGYLGGAPSSQSLAVSATEGVQLDVTAKNDQIRNVLAELAKIALLDQGAFHGSSDAELELSKTTAEKILSASDGLTELRARIGEKQERVEIAKVQNQSESFGLQASRNELVGIDPFETASKLADIQLQLESFYLVTAKTARLNLSEYLR